MFCRLLTLLLNWDPYSCLLLYTQWRARCFSPFLPSLDIFSFWQCRCSFRPLLDYHLQASQGTRSLHKSPLISTAMPWVGMTWTFQISTLENRKSKPREADSSHESPEENSMCLPELLGTPLIVSAGVGGPCISSVRCALLAVWWDRWCSLGVFLPGMLMSLVILNWHVQAPDSRLWIKRNVRHLEGTMKDQPLASLNHGSCCSPRWGGRALRAEGSWEWECVSWGYTCPFALFFPKMPASPAQNDGRCPAPLVHEQTLLNAMEMIIIPRPEYFTFSGLQEY